MDKKIVFARGEVTGHNHGTDSAGIVVKEEKEGLVTCFDTEEEKVVVHPEHAPITLPAKKDIKVGIAEEVDPITEEARRVQD